MPADSKSGISSANHPAPMAGRTWRNASSALSFEIRNHLVRRGGIEDRHLPGDREIWRVRLGKAVFTRYETGTVYCSGRGEPEIGFVYQQIDAAIRSARSEVNYREPPTGLRQRIGRAL